MLLARLNSRKEIAVLIPPVSPLEYKEQHNIPALPRFTIESMGLGTLDDIATPYAGEHFRENFSGHAEDPIEATIIREHHLKVDAHDFTTRRSPGILDELGGQTSAPILLGQFWYLLGVLERRRHTAYVRKDDVVLTVSASWIFKGRQTVTESLFIESSPINKPYPRGAGCCILSR